MYVELWRRLLWRIIMLCVKHMIIITIYKLTIIYRLYYMFSYIVISVDPFKYELVRESIKIILKERTLKRKKLYIKIIYI